MSAPGNLAANSRVDEVLDGYAAAAMPDLIARYESFQSTALYHPVLDLLPAQPTRIADIGAGTGRDAAWFASLGHQVVAVEPVAALRAAGLQLHPDPAIVWLDDRLPELPDLSQMAPFGLVTAYGVLQHLDVDDQRRALAAMTGVLAEKGRLILTLRHGPAVPGRPVYPHDTDGLIAHARMLGLACIRSVAKQSIQAENRALGVHWTCLAFQKEA